MPAYKDKERNTWRVSFNYGVEGTIEPVRE